MQLKVDETIVDEIKNLLDQIHTEMYQKALKDRVDNIVEIDNWDDFMKTLNARKQCMAPWCNV